MVHLVHEYVYYLEIYLFLVTLSHYIYTCKVTFNFPLLSYTCLRSRTEDVTLLLPAPILSPCRVTSADQQEANIAVICNSAYTYSFSQHHIQRLLGKKIDSIAIMYFLARILNRVICQ